MATIRVGRLSTRIAGSASSLIRQSFICQRCLHQQTTNEPAQSMTTSAFLSAFKKPGHYRLRYSTVAADGTSSRTQNLGAAFQQTRELPARASRLPAKSSKYVAYWLLGSAASVFGIVIFGGLTRLTESGLSITEWKPITGSVPPRSLEEWEAEFARYKASPEFIMLNSRMDLEDFKKIYWMEWIHRQWGRIVGITFLLPTIGFVVARRVSRPMAFRLVGICGLIGFQGFLGWWMVKSGLKDDLFAPGSHPRVSQYRLAAHLGTAFVAYMAMLWNGLRILQVYKIASMSDVEQMKLVSAAQAPALKRFKIAFVALSALIFTTVMSGALVAGLDAGLIYNDFPWMGQTLLPPKSELLDPFYCRLPSQMDIIPRNMLENPVTVQLDHRILATTTFFSVLALWAYSRSARLRPLLKTTGAAKGALGLVHLVSLQVTLGITTLWYLVPTPLASAHQAGALLLLSGAVVLGTRVWLPRAVVRRVHQLQNRIVSASRTQSTGIHKLTPRSI